ncbi:MAG: hypothetical protein ACYDB1_10880 [Acidiferrobacteraceae bacterium]
MRRLGTSRVRVNRREGGRIDLDVAPEGLGETGLGSCIRRQPLEVSARFPGRRGFNRLFAMGLQPLPHPDDRCWGVTLERVQEGDEERPMTAGVGMQTEIQFTRSATGGMTTAAMAEPLRWGRPR